MRLVSRSPRLMGFKTTWGRLFLALTFSALMLPAFYTVFNTRWSFCVPRLAVECLNWNFGILDKWQKAYPEKGQIYGFLSRNMVIYKDGEKIAKRVAATGLDEVVINENEEVLVNGVKKARGLQMAAKLGKDREDFMGSAVMEPGQIFGMGDTWTSYDSRYWGPVDEERTVGRLYIIL